MISNQYFLTLPVLLHVPHSPLLPEFWSITMNSQKQEAHCPSLNRRPYLVPQPHPPISHSPLPLHGIEELIPLFIPWVHALNANPHYHHYSQLSVSPGNRPA